MLDSISTIRVETVAIACSWGIVVDEGTDSTYVLVVSGVVACVGTGMGFGLQEASFDDG